MRRQVPHDFPAPDCRLYGAVHIFGNACGTVSTNSPVVGFRTSMLRPDSDGTFSPFKIICMLGSQPFSGPARCYTGLDLGTPEMSS